MGRLLKIPGGIPDSRIRTKGHRTRIAPTGAMNKCTSGGGVPPYFSALYAKSLHLDYMMLSRIELIVGYLLMPNRLGSGSEEDTDPDAEKQRPLRNRLCSRRHWNTYCSCFQ